MSEDLAHTSSADTSGNPPSRPTEAKRRRVTRACDYCRLKKVKCDGRQPCIHCTVYSFKCTYERPNIRNRKGYTPIPTVPQSTSLLQSIAMNKQPSSNTINENLVLSQNILNSLFPSIGFNFFDESPQEFDFKKFQKIVSHLQTKNPAKLNIHEISDMYLNDSGTSPSPTPHSDCNAISTPDDSIGAEIKILLPPKETALQLIYTTWNKACVLFRFYHRPSLLQEVDLLYSIDVLNYTDRQQKFLPFMYSLLACGSLFSKSSDRSANNESLEDDGFKYFLEARKLIDITNVSDIPSIQTIVMMIIYLQCSARLSTCYSYIGIALRSALKEGLHRNLEVFHSRRKLDPIEIDTRKRLFYTIYKMDIYINSLLGLPGSINEDEFDQDFPIELDDELITRDSFHVDKQNGRLSSSACANHHTKLTMLLSRIVKELYPIKVKPKIGSSNPSPNIHDTVTTLEFELKNWMENVPLELRPTDPSNSNGDSHIPERFKLANYYLHVAFLNCQISLYRPFIHYISNGNHSKNADPRSLIRGRNCIKVARLVVKLANKMIDQNLLVGTYWFSMYTIFFSIACLAYYFHFANYNNSDNNLGGVNYAGVYFDDDLNIDMIRNDIEIGKKVLDNMKNMSHSSLRIYNILNKLFEQLNRKTATSSMRNGGVPNVDSYNDAMVKLSMSNFDMINQFEVDGKINTQDEIGEKGNDNGSMNGLFDFVSDKQTPANVRLNQKVTQNIPTDADYGIEYRDQRYGNVLKEESNTKQDPTLRIKDPDSGIIEDLIEPSVNYVPGVIDALDTQIFGRLLPPYMIEGNIRQAGETGLDRRYFETQNNQGFQYEPDYSQLDSGVYETDPLASLDPF
ncbi:hypothetical protein JCM33374_g2808 [Metschnikowia sp. JCM 33374]|nr:hypothetical protein JCM33374_g2808 [Metschnikowia sp. JCM 33374]